MKFSIFNFQFSIKKGGFTLLELLVVVGIITILVTLGLSSFATAQKKGRDAKRKSDIREISGALEQYYSVCGFAYPDWSGGVGSSVVCSSPSIAIMPTVNKDPQGNAYGCTSCDTSKYTLCANNMEADSAFCISNQQ